jgi:predicted RNA-binding Zn-ribbon protein involved in translation (DUF1610 family)
MEENVKKSLMIGIAVVCLGVAVVIAVMRGSNDPLKEIADEEIVQLKCRDCGATSEMSMKDFAAYALKNHDINGAALPMTCEKCNKTSLVEAIKCEKCGEIFFLGAAGPGKVPDACPKCGYSAEKERRQSAQR